MTPSPPSPSPLTALQKTWAQSDLLFTHITPSNALSRPISLRHPFIFYLGHLPAFTWNTIRRTPSPSPPLPPLNPQFETLFERGIDPDVDETTTTSAPQWPSWTDVTSYRDQVRTLVLHHATPAPPSPARISPRAITLVAEHEAMHVETLQYMLAQSLRRLPICCTRPATATAPPPAPAARPAVSWARVPAGVVRTGRARDGPFGWDNEFDTTTRAVRAFRLARHAVSARDFAAFVAAGGYDDATFWDAASWAWLQRDGISHPASWECDGTRARGRVRLLTGGADGPWEFDASDVSEGGVGAWPASVSLAEARAYARWAGARLCSEAEWVRAAEGARVEVGEAGERPVSVLNGGAKDGGVCQLFGNGWELTTSVFEGFEGFVPTVGYETYSQDFFDGKHFVLRGASWVTQSVCRRVSFRNFFQERYPFVFSKFRLACDDDDEEEMA